MITKPFTDYEECFEFYNSNKYKTDEYSLRFKKQKINSQLNTIYEENLYDDIVKYDENKACLIANDYALKRFHPNNIDNKKFWEIAKSKFRFLSVSGMKSKSYKEVNKNTLLMSKYFGLFSFMENEINNTKDLNVLEIGYGYGGVFNEVNKKCNYIGIDYTKPKFLKKYKSLIEIKESGIPKDLMIKNYYDFVYSVNVLQHCSQVDRFKYIAQASYILKNGGYFIFSSFIMTEENKNVDCWGIKNSDGRGYTHFFNQLTEVDFDHELKSWFEELGFKILKFEVSHKNMLSCILVKKENKI